MPVTACPVTIIDVPAARVWSLLADPQKLDWSDARFEEAEPEGPVHVGQRWRCATTALGRRWPVMMTVTSIAADHQSLGLDIALPLGIRNREHITLARLADDRTRVQFN